MINGVDYFSSKTSIKRIPKGIPFLVLAYTGGTGVPDKKHLGNNLDYGGGRYDLSTQYLKKYAIRNYVYDPFNRTPEHNKRALKHKFQSVTLLNVLNTIESREERIQVIRDAYLRLEPRGIFVVQIYEGNRSGVGKISKTRTYQHNQPFEYYLDEIKEALQWRMPWLAVHSDRLKIMSFERLSPDTEDFLKQGYDAKAETVQEHCG